MNIEAYLKESMQEHLFERLIPFWIKQKDEIYGGYYGHMDSAGTVFPKDIKGMILHSRILWFFSQAYLLTGDKKLLQEADHCFDFLQKGVDQEQGGIYWSLDYQGVPEDTTKHTYNMAFFIYALCAYFEAKGEGKAYDLAWQTFGLIEEKCFDGEGYLEAFDQSFAPLANDKLSENGVMAERTMNTLLHLLEAYTQLYRVIREREEKQKVKDRLDFILQVIMEKIYNPKKRRQEVFFDLHYKSLIDLHSYGHDIEAAWLMDLAADVLGEKETIEKVRKITDALREQIYEEAFTGDSLLNEAEENRVDPTRIWWVQAEAVAGFYKGYKKDPKHRDYLLAAEKIWNYIRSYLIPESSGLDWYYQVDENGAPDLTKAMVSEWKCPYHNGRMCIEIIGRDKDAT